MRRDPRPPHPCLSEVGQCVAHPRGSLERHLPRPAPTEDEMFALRRAAWRKQGLMVIRLADVQDEWLRQALINVATRLYGAREDA